MGRLAVREVIEGGWLCCPRCRSNLRLGKSRELACDICGSTFGMTDADIPLMAPDSDGLTAETQRFWSALYEAAYAGHHQTLGVRSLDALLDKLEQLLRHRRHLAVCEMPIDDLAGRQVLEVGSGAGAHAALFSRRGATMCTVDLTVERVTATARLLDLLDNPSNFCLQGDARSLPFPDDAFDIVYSNGVLHHTTTIEQAVDEVRRVLRPGGLAVIMLYARNSFLYRGVLLPVRGVLQGGLWHDRRWLGRATEWMSSQPQVVSNPLTRVFSACEARRLFDGFQEISIRKNAFMFSQVPILGASLSRLAGMMTGYNDAGLLVYERPWRNETRFELWLGQYVGWGLNILAVK